MNNVSRRKSYLTVGILGLILSAGYLGMSLRLPMGDLAQPGAGVFPVMVAVTLIIGSLLTVAEGWRHPRHERVELPQGTNRTRVLLLIAYVVLLPWLGQFIASLIFCVLLLRLLSDLSWLRVVVYAVLMTVALYLIFIYLLKIPMPAGLLGVN